MTGKNKRKQPARELGRKRAKTADTAKTEAAKPNKTGRCDASDALLDIFRLSESSVRVMLAPGWKSVLPQKGEDDPGCLIMWDDFNVDATVIRFNNAIAAGGVPAPPAWLNVPVGGGPITVPHLKAAILTHVQTTGGGGGVVGNALIAPNNLNQYGQLTTAFSFIGFEPFFIAHTTCPIGRHYVLAESRASARNTAVADSILAPPVGLGVAVFN
jgi:hypothetical protein